MISFANVQVPKINKGDTNLITAVEELQAQVIAPQKMEGHKCVDKTSNKITLSLNIKSSTCLLWKYFLLFSKSGWTRKTKVTISRHATVPFAPSHMALSVLTLTLSASPRLPGYLIVSAVISRATGDNSSN